MKYNDLTQIRHEKTSKKLWRAAAAVAKIDLSEWMRTRLDGIAQMELKTLGTLPHD